MILSLNRSRRSGATAAELALVYPPLLLFTFGLIVVGLGIFRYQMTAALAREGARWASVHGAQWAADQNSPLTTQTNVRDAILPHAAGLDPSKLACLVSWPDSSTDQWPTRTDNGKTNTVTVTVNYNWVPELYLGTMTLSSTSTMTISY